MLTVSRLGHRSFYHHPRSPANVGARMLFGDELELKVEREQLMNNEIPGKYTRKTGYICHHMEGSILRGIGVWSWIA